MKMRITLFVLLALPCAFLVGGVVETAQFEEVMKHVHQYSSRSMLVICDIDNTLLRGTSHLGSVSWGEHMTSRLQNSGMSREDAIRVESVLWQTVQPHIRVDHVDPKAPSVISELQERNIPVMGLTARAANEVGYTADQLKSLGISLSNTSQLLNSQSLDMEDPEILYEKGILFGGLSNKKSKVLFTFLDTHAISPEVIIFIDDKMHHISDLERACDERGILYVGIRFSGADDHVKRFDSQLADIQWAAFPSLLSNEEAEHIRLTQAQ